MQIALDSVYIVGPDVVFLEDPQQRFDGPMRRAARGVVLRDGAARKLVTFAQIACHRLPIDVVFLTKGVGHPLRSFQN